ncbi:MAG: hypothetical protein DME09_12275 [Candidatus Rokuibacteriota bacterium]|nr:MAG: hypothetical protein DME09_12275 [Candidatus Rokubacteria bacterium]
MPTCTRCFDVRSVTTASLWLRGRSTHKRPQRKAAQTRHVSSGDSRKSEQRYRLLFQLNPAGMFQSRRGGPILERNDAFVRLLGFSSRAEVPSHNLREFYANPEEHDELMARLRPGGVMTNQKLPWRRHDGAPLSVLLNLRQDEGEVLEGLVIDMPSSGLTGRRNSS